MYKKTICILVLIILNTHLYTDDGDNLLTKAKQAWSQPTGNPEEMQEANSNILKVLYAIDDPKELHAINTVAAIRALYRPKPGLERNGFGLDPDSWIQTRRSAMLTVTNAWYFVKLLVPLPEAGLRPPAGITKDVIDWSTEADKAEILAAWSQQGQSLVNAAKCRRFCQELLTQAVIDLHSHPPHMPLDMVVSLQCLELSPRSIMEHLQRAKGWSSTTEDDKLQLDLTLGSLQHIVDSLEAAND